MSLISLILLFAFIGLITWALVTYVPMPQGVKTVIVAVVVICMVLYVASLFGIGDIRVGRPVR